MTTDIEVGEFLEHFGVKGMKWGVRNSERTARVASGNGSTGDKVRKVAGSSAVDLIRGKGVQGAAKIQVARGERKANLKTARKEVRGEIKAYATANKKRVLGASVAGALIGGPGGALGVMSATVMRSQGHSRGKSAVLGYLGGPIGGILASEVSARKRAASMG